LKIGFGFPLSLHRGVSLFFFGQKVSGGGATLFKTTLVKGFLWISPRDVSWSFFFWGRGPRCVLWWGDVSLFQNWFFLFCLRFGGKTQVPQTKKKGFQKGKIFFLLGLTFVN